MCGICGALRFDGLAVSPTTIAKMSAVMHHRGPDGDGVWTNGPIGLGHRRLAIIDLTPAGHQPMSNQSGDVLITYNGELYNYQNLRVELEAKGHRFHSRSDTETVLHAYEEWGPGCLDRFDGMYAFAIWNDRERRLFLARDRYGVKPLYYFDDGAKFLFASEVKSILEYPGVRRRVNYQALNEYFSFQNVLTDLTLFDGVKLLPPGHHLTIDLGKGTKPVIERYWDYPMGAEPLKITREEASEELHRLFVNSVTRQLVSDVPVASYLSGGMDSGSITAVARQHLGRLTTFTCGFDMSSASGLEMGFDERAHSEVLANLFKTEHYEMVLHAGDMEHILPELIWHLEDLRVGQCYPNYYVARLAGKFVKVVLSGAGGDELFGGYPWRYYTGIASANADDYFRNYYDWWQRLVPDSDKPGLFNDETLRQVGDHSTFEVFKNVFQSADLRFETPGDYLNASLYFELKTFLHGLFVVEDKVSMANSLETRVPFLDNELVDFAMRLPPDYKVSDLAQTAREISENDVSKAQYQQTRRKTDKGKEVLRNAMRRLIPDEVSSRAKQGFSAPDATWFRGESIDYVNDLLRDPHTRIYDYLAKDYVENRLDLHTGGKQNHRLFIWSLLSFEWWLRKFMDH